MHLAAGVDIEQADLVFRVGETPDITHRVNIDAPGDSIESATIAIHDAEGTAVVPAGAVTVSPGAQEATSHTLTYLFAIGANPPGEYTYRLAYTRGNGAVRIIPGEFTVRPAFSPRDRYVRRVAVWLRRGAIQPLHRPLSEPEVLSALDAAALAYSRIRPQDADDEVATTDGSFEFDLPDAWVSEFSEIREVIYPWDPDEQARPAYSGAYVRTDELRGKWWLVSATTEATKVARVIYTVPRILTDAEVTVPSHAFESVTQYAAGVALDMLANEASGREAPQHAADIVGYQDRQQKYRAQAEAMMAAAERQWRRMEER